MIYTVYVWETRKAVKNIVDGKTIEFSTYESAKKFAVGCEANSRVDWQRRGKPFRHFQVRPAERLRR